MSQLSYTYESNGKNFNKEHMYPGERILYKNEDVKYEDNKNNKEYNTNCFFTNFRIVIRTPKYVFDIPLPFIKTHYVKKPFIRGSPYIYIEFDKNLSLLNSYPLYIAENFTQAEIMNSMYKLPEYTMIKFRDKEGDIDKSYEVLKLGINAKEYNMSFKQAGPQQNAEPIQTYQNSVVGGLGIERTKNLMMQKMKNESQLISGSFSDIQSLRTNAQAMIDLAQQIRAKINIKKDQPENEAKELNGILSKIGFIDPVTKEVAGRDYYFKLAEQINEYFCDYFEKNPNIKVLTLIDAYCIYNRARGGNTVSPKDMTQALDHFKSISQKVLLKEFNKEMIVLHTKDYTNENILVSVVHFMEEKKEDFITVNDLARVINAKNVILEKILIDDLLRNGFLCVDESDFDIRYYQNTILNYKRLSH